MLVCSRDKRHLSSLVFSRDVHTTTRSKSAALILPRNTGEEEEEEDKARDIPSSRENLQQCAEKKFCGYRSFKETFISNWVTDRYLIKRYEKNEILGRPRVGATEQLPIPRELRRPRSHRTVGELFVYVLLVFILCLLCVRNLCSSFLFLFSASTSERTWVPLMR